MEGIGRRTQGRTGGDDVVDHEDPLPRRPRARPEDRTVETGSPIPAGLGRVVALALEQAATRHPELGRDPPGDELRLIEPTAPPPPAARRRPGDGVDVVGPDTGREQPVHQQPGDVMAELTSVAVLEPQDDVARSPGEGQGGDDVTGSGQRHRGGEGEAAAAAEHRPDSITTGAT